MNNNNTYEKEREVLIDEETANDVGTGNREEPNVNFGIELEDYLRQIETEFAPLSDQVSAEELIKIKHDLRQIRNGEIDPQRAEQASQTLLKVFKNMEAWHTQMRALAESKPVPEPDATRHYYGSKQVFMESCNELYPGKDASLTLIGSEIYTIKREMSVLTDSDMLEQIKKLGDLETLANQIDEKAEKDPHGTVKDLEQIMLVLSNGVEKDLKRQDLNKEEQKQLNLVVEIIYKLQILIDKIKSSKAYREQVLSHKELASVGKTEKKEEEREWKIEQAEKIWNEFLKKDLGTIEEYLNKEVRSNFDSLSLDAKQNDFVSAQLPVIWEDYKSDQRAPKHKLEDYKLRIGELMKKASSM